MNKKTKALICSLIICLTGYSQQASAQYIEKYKDPGLGIEVRTHDLLGRMTLEEKVGQLLCPLGWEMYEKKGQEVT
ncbi:hypothetical protein GGR21_004230, partial [Dysgonomonas hofstadii]